MAAAKGSQSAQRSKDADPEPSSFRFTSRGDGTSSIDATGPYVLAGGIVVIQLVYLVFNPAHADAAGLVLGTLHGVGIVIVSWALATGRITQRDLFKGARFKAVRRKDGGVELHGHQAGAATAALVLTFLVQAFFAQDSLWAYWLGLGAVLLAAGGSYLVVRFSKAPVKDAP